MSEKPEGLVPVSEILPEVLAKIPGMGAYLRKIEEQEKGMVVTDLEAWFEHGEAA